MNKNTNTFVETFKFQFQREIEVIPVCAIELALNRKYTSAIVTYLKLKSLLKISYGSFKIEKIKFVAKLLKLKLQTFKKHLDLLFKLGYLRYAKDNTNLIQIVSKHKKNAVSSVGVISTADLFAVNDTITYQEFRAYLTEILIDLDIRKKIAKTRIYKKCYGKNSKEFTSLNKWTRECKKDLMPIATSYVSSLNKLSKTTTANYRTKLSKLESVKYLNKVAADRNLSVTALYTINDDEKIKLEHDLLQLKNYGYYFINSKREVVKRFIAIRKVIDTLLIKRYCNNILKRNSKSV